MDMPGRRIDAVRQILSGKGSPEFIVEGKSWAGARGSGQRCFTLMSADGTGPGPRVMAWGFVITQDSL